MDALGGRGEDVVSAKKQYATSEEQVDRFLESLQGLSNKEAALHPSGVLSEEFWLKRAMSK